MKIEDKRVSRQELALDRVKCGEAVAIAGYSGFWIRSNENDVGLIPLVGIEDGTTIDFTKDKLVTLVNATVTITDA